MLRDWNVLEKQVNSGRIIGGSNITPNSSAGGHFPGVSESGEYNDEEKKNGNKYLPGPK